MHVPGETQFLRTFQAYKIGELGLKESWKCRAYPASADRAGQRTVNPTR